MQQFKIFLKNEKLNSYHRLHLFITAIFLLLYIFIAFFSKNDLHLTGKIITLAFVAFFILARIFLPGRIKGPWLWAILFVLGIGFVYLKFYWIGILCSLLALLLQYVVKDKIAGFFTSHIEYPSFPPKKIGWNELNNCLIKDTLLTIDFKNNRMIQQVVDEKSTRINEKEFNDFCREQLLAANLTSKSA